MIARLIGMHSGTVHTSIYILFTAITFWWLMSLSLLSVLTWYISAQILVGLLTSGFQHRYCSHRSWQPPRWLEVFLVFTSAGFVMSPSMAYAALHRQHHRYADREGDPHGWFGGLWNNFLVFNKRPPIKMIPRWMFRDKLYMFQARFYWEIALVYGLTFTLLGLGQWWISIVAAGYFLQVLLNLLGHTRQLTTRDNKWFAFFFSGELYHTYHHTKPNEKKFGLMDPPYWLMIRWFDNETKRSKRNSNNLGKTA